MLHPTLALGRGTFANVLMEFTVVRLTAGLNVQSVHFCNGKTKQQKLLCAVQALYGGGMLILAHAHISWVISSVSLAY